MTEDERAIRALVQTWMEASRAGDTGTVLSLMAEDMVFMVPGQEPFGKQAFAEMSKSMQGMQMEGSAEIRELEVHGSWAWIRTWIDVTMTPPGAEPVRRAGYTLGILKKGGDGKWRLARDANLVGPVA